MLRRAGLLAWVTEKYVLCALIGLWTRDIYTLNFIKLLKSNKDGKTLKNLTAG